MQGSFYLPRSGGIFHIYLTFLGTDFIGVSLQILGINILVLHVNVMLLQDRFCSCRPPSCAETTS